MAAMSESIRQLLRQEKLDTLRQSDRVNRMTPDAQKEEAEYLLRQQIIRTQVVSREKWEYRRRAKQTVMPLFSGVGIPV
jgi:preprotein translocase subunit Sec63